MKVLKDVVFVCSAIKDGKLMSEIVIATSLEMAKENFEKAIGVKPENISGPFYHKKSNVIKKNTEIKFSSGSSKKAVYKGWRVSAMPLQSPPNSAFVFFDQRIDGQKMQKPETMIVNIEELENDEVEKNLFSQDAKNAGN